MRLLFPFRDDVMTQVTIFPDPCVISTFPVQQTRLVPHIPSYLWFKHYKTFFTRVTAHQIQWRISLTKGKPDDRKNEMQDFPDTFQRFQTFQFQWSAMRKFMDLEIRIWESFSATLPECSTVCHITEACRQDCTAMFSYERYSAVEFMNLVFLFNVFLVSKRRPMTKSADKASHLRNRRQTRNHREPAFTSFLATRAKTVSVRLNSFEIRSSIKYFRCTKGIIEKAVNMLCTCDCLCFMHIGVFG
jgi:hypothetical protein